ncbi:MAG: PRC-barrel domain containing protein [Acidimicrobiia bacterium]|nr:PRC-barrel domain containing protein [Acidimicrobiia bacterium]
MTDVWVYQVEVAEIPDLTGYDVVATDGEIGRVDEATYEDGSGSLVVDTGWWIFGKKRMLPAGTISSIDLGERKVQVRLSKDQIKSAPDYDVSRRHDAGFREDHESYYLGF